MTPSRFKGKNGAARSATTARGALAKSGMNRPVVSLFTGAMGLDLGLESVGLGASLAIEFDSHCCSTIRQNRPEMDVLEGDIQEVDGDTIKKRLGKPKDVFLVVGGPPCQSFCPGGKRAALSDPRGNLIYTHLKIVRELQPKFFVLENVANIVTAAIKHRPISERPGKNWNLSAYTGNGAGMSLEPEELSGSAIRQIVTDVRELGYDVSLSVVDAADYGAPQHRLRFLLIGSRDGLAPEIPQPTHGEHAEDGFPLLTVRDAIYDLRQEPGPHSEYTPDVAKYFAMIPPGGNWRSLPKDIQREALGGASFEAGGGKTGFYRRLSWNRPAPTITGRANRKGSALCHPDYVRPLSVKECARIQGFPDDWQFSGAMSSQYLQVGNAVPVHLGAAIGRTLLQGKPAGPAPAKFNDALESALERAVRRLRDSARNKRGKSDGKQPVLF